MDDIFPILALETSDELCSVAVLLSENSFSEINVKGKHIHSEKLIPMIEEILKTNNLQVSQIKSIAVSEGPGSFTGLRIGMAAVKGIVVSTNIPVMPVPTFSAVAFKISAFMLNGQNFVIVKKASRDEVYFARYLFSENKLKDVVSLCLIKISEISSKVEKNDLVFSNIIHQSNSVDITPSALDIGRWAYKFGKDLVTSNYDLLEPKYFKEFKVRSIA